MEIILTNQAKIGQFMTGCKDGFHSEDLSFKQELFKELDVERETCIKDIADSALYFTNQKCRRII